jgi:Na+/H+-translocating membrane pyrophosphatase
MPTQASLSEMIPPGCLVMMTPVVVGVLFGTRCLAGVLAGALVSGVQMAVSMSNTGGAWDNAKKYVEVRPMPIWNWEPSSVILVIPRGLAHMRMSRTCVRG